jgi:hypothetical protein
LVKITCTFNGDGQAISADTIDISIFIEEIIVLITVQNKKIRQNELGKPWIFLQLFRTIMANIQISGSTRNKTQKRRLTEYKYSPKLGSSWTLLP